MARSGLMILRYEMISCFTLEMSRDDLRGALEELVLDPVELVSDLVEDREAVVEEIVEDVVEQVAGALAEQVVAEPIVVLDAAEES